MKTVHVALVALVALTVGIGLGYLLADEPPSPAPPIQAATEQVPSPVVAAAPSPAVKAPEPVVRPEPAPISRPAMPDTMPEWIAKLEGTIAEPGDGTIHGRVTLADGTPLAEVEIIISANWPHPALAGQLDQPVEAVIEDYARRTYFSRNSRQSTQTDAEGRYSFSGLGDYQFTVIARRLGYRFSQENPGRRGGIRAKEAPEVNFRAAVVCELELDVRLPDGTQPKSASTNLVASNNSSRGGGWRPDSARQEIDAGHYTLTVSAGDHGEYQSDPVTVDIEPGKPLSLTVHLKFVPGVVVKLVFPTGVDTARRSRNTVRMIANPTPEPPKDGDQPGIEGRWSGGEDVRTFPNLTPGPYRALLLQRNKVLAWQDFVLGNEFKEITLTVPEPDVKDYIAVRALGPDGKPDPSVSFNLAMKAESASSSGGAEVIRRPDNLWWISRTRPEHGTWPDNWWYEVTATSTTNGTLTVKYPKDATHELVIQFEPPCKVTILIPGAETHPMRARLRPSLSMRTENSPRGTSWSQVMTGASRSGRPEALADSMHFAPVSPGRYKFVLTLNPAGSDGEWMGPRENVTILEHEFDVVGGENTRSVAIPAFYTLTLRIADPKAISHLELRAPGTTQRSRSFWSRNIKERTLIEGLTPGNWVIVTRQGEMPVTVSGDMEVDLQVRAFDCMVFNGIQPGGKIEAMGLRDGDKLIRVDGQEWETLEQLQMQTQGALSKDETTWTVIRNGNLTDVKLNGKELFRIVSERGENREQFHPRPGLRD